LKILSIVGARPQFIKAAMVSRAIRKQFKEILLHTGQHYDDNMSKVFFDELEIPYPNIQLGIGSGTHAEQTARMLIGIEQVLIAERPDWVIIFGDTNSTIAGALAAVKLNMPVAHVEAGLRSYNRTMPEEINRIVSDQLSSALFCPTQQAVLNLARENVINNVFVVGDVMGDALNHFLPIASQKSKILSKLGLQPKSYALATIHRAGNTDDKDRLSTILSGLGQLPSTVVFPVHPRTRKNILDSGLSLHCNILPIDPIGYLDMLWLEANAACVLTDSGGVQKEAYWLGIKCVTLREETEWVETVENGWNRLVGADIKAIIDAFCNWNPDQIRPPLYGNGFASEAVASFFAANK
jgi:UDP-GlcNAc3NAcA epimerase